jgi:tetratricopeptide (TPR) repeat protein
VSGLLDDLTMVDRLEEIRLEQSQIVDGHFDIAGADAAYAQVFRDYGVDVEALGPEAAAWIRTRSIAVELAVALDDWAMARLLGKGKDDGSWKQLLLIARVADPNPLRTRVRQALETRSKDALEQLANTVAGADLPATTLDLVGKALRDLGASAQAIALLREGQRRYPGDFWLNQNLALLLKMAKPPQSQEAIRFHTAALALRPDNPGVFNNLGNALRDQGRLDEAEAAYRKAIELKSDCFEAYNNLGIALRDKGAMDEAVTAYRKAIELKPDLAIAHYNLGITLGKQGRTQEAIAAYQGAIRAKPDYARAYVNLGALLCDQKRDYDGAIAAFRKAIEVQADSAEAYGNLGIALQNKGALDEAVAAFFARRSI